MHNSSKDMNSANRIKKPEQVLELRKECLVHKQWWNWWQIQESLHTSKIHNSVPSLSSFRRILRWWCRLFRLTHVLWMFLRNLLALTWWICKHKARKIRKSRKIWERKWMKYANKKMLKNLRKRRNKKKKLSQKKKSRLDNLRRMLKPRKQKVTRLIKRKISLKLYSFMTKLFNLMKTK